MPPSDNPSPKPIPYQVSQLALDPSSLPTPISTIIQTPQPAGPKQLSIEYNANAPGKLDPKVLNSLDSSLSGNAEPNSPSLTLTLPVQLDFNGPNSPNLDSSSNLALTLASPQPLSLPGLILDGSVITANSLSQFVIGGKHCSQAGQRLQSLERHQVSRLLLRVLLLLVIQSSSQNLPRRCLHLLRELPHPIQSSESQYLIDGQTLILYIHFRNTYISCAFCLRSYHWK